MKTSRKLAGGSTIIQVDSYEEVSQLHLAPHQPYFLPRWVQYFSPEVSSGILHLYFITWHCIQEKSRLISSAPMFLQFCKNIQGWMLEEDALMSSIPSTITFFCVKKLYCEPTHILTCEAKHNSLISIRHSAKRIGLETPKAYQEVLSSKMVSSVRQNLITICASAINGFENTC